MKTLCPICSSVLLRHICKSRIMWFCLECHQEMPNFDLVKCHTFQDQFQQLDNDFEPSKDIRERDKNHQSYPAIKYDSKIIDLFINQDKKRL